MREFRSDWNDDLDGETPYWLPSDESSRSMPAASDCRRMSIGGRESAAGTVSGYTGGAYICGGEGRYCISCWNADDDWYDEEVVDGGGDGRCWSDEPGIG